MGLALRPQSRQNVVPNRCHAAVDDGDERGGENVRRTLIRPACVVLFALLSVWPCPEARADCTPRDAYRRVFEVAVTGFSNGHWNYACTVTDYPAVRCPRPRPVTPLEEASSTYVFKQGKPAECDEGSPCVPPLEAATICCEDFYGECSCTLNPPPVDDDPPLDDKTIPG